METGLSDSRRNIEGGDKEQVWISISLILIEVLEQEGEKEKGFGV